MKRRTNVNNDDSYIRLKTNVDEKDLFRKLCYKSDISMSNVIRLAVNKYFNQEVFVLQEEG